MKNLKDLFPQFENDEAYFHPDLLMTKLYEYIKSIGTNTFLHGDGLNAEREVWVGCLFAYALRKYLRNEIYIKRGDDPPDLSLAAISDRPVKEKSVDEYLVEVVEVPPSVDESTNPLETAKALLLNAKFLKKSVQSKNTHLLIFLNSNNSVSLSEGLVPFLQSQSDVKFKEILCLYLVSVNKEQGFIYYVKSMTHPDQEWQIILGDEFNKGTKYPSENMKKLVSRGILKVSKIL